MSQGPTRCTKNAWTPVFVSLSLLNFLPGTRWLPTHPWYPPQVLGTHGYNPKTSINLVSTCRDELCRPFTDNLDAV